MSFILTTATLFVCCTAVPQNPPPAAEAKPAAAQDQAPAKLDPANYDHFGTGITKGEAPAPVLDALKDPAKFIEKTVRLEGRITSVCQTKGCWMQLGTERNPMLVKFKDYAFFMPKDASGRTAIVEGEMTLKRETVEETKHYLEDAGKPEEAAKVTEGRLILTFLASGVALKKVQAKFDDKVYDHFGTGIAPGDAPVSIADVQKDPAQYVGKGKTVRLEGPITAVCQTKGCWMHLGTEANPVMVKFKDYAFFMPKDASGRTAVVEGEIVMKQETVEQTRHYLEDAGKKDEAAKVTEGRKILTFTASGVAIKKAGS
jgi:hypothetical protein